MCHGVFLTWMNISDLERKGVLQILLYLLKNNEGASINELGRELSVTVSTLRKTTLPLLREWGLIKYEEIGTFQRAHIHTLTDKGTYFAKCLKYIQDQ